MKAAEGEPVLIKDALSLKKKPTAQHLFPWDNEYFLLE